MKNARILREYVRSIISEGIISPDDEKAQGIQDATKIMQNVNSWLSSNKEAIYEAADYYNNPLPQQRESLADLIKGAFANDKSSGHEYPFTTYALCIQIAGSEDIFTTELLDDVTSAIMGMFSSLANLFERKSTIKEAFQLGAGAIAAIVAAVLWGIDAIDSFDEEDLGVTPETADAVKSAASTKVMKIARAVKPADGNVAIALDQIAKGSKTDQINL